jgi:hypothetical protein
MEMIAGVECCQDVRRTVWVPCGCVEVDHAIERATAANPLVDGLALLLFFRIMSRIIMQETANLYGVSEQALYRALEQRAPPRALRRSDRGTPRVLPQDKMEYYCELIAANQGSDIE